MPMLDLLMLIACVFHQVSLFVSQSDYLVFLSFHFSMPMLDLLIESVLSVFPKLPVVVRVVFPVLLFCYYLKNLFFYFGLKLGLSNSYFDLLTLK